MMVPLGVSRIQMDTKVMTVTKNNNQVQDKAFDQGILDVEFTLQEQIIEKNGVSVRQLLLKESILQLNDKELELDVFVQQIIDGSFFLNI